MTWLLTANGTYSVLNRNGSIAASGCTSATEAALLIAVLGG